ncbi:MAG TPA: DMT family transporter [Gaiellaceae bacterium]|nr:DMT family transporter [Gaiellaceae bacterium]
MRQPRALTGGVNARAHISLLAVVVVWAGSFSVIEALLYDEVAAGGIAILRYAIAAPGFAYILWRARGLPGLTRGDAARVVAAGLLIVVGYHMFLNVGTRYTTSGIAALVVALAPGMTMILAFALGLDRVTTRRIVGLALALALAVAFAGVAIVIALGSGRELSLEGTKGPFGALFLDETVTLWLALGGLLVIGGIATAQGVSFARPSGTVARWRSALSRSAS